MKPNFNFVQAQSIHKASTVVGIKNKGRSFKIWTKKSSVLLFPKAWNCPL